MVERVEVVSAVELEQLVGVVGIGGPGLGEGADESHGVIAAGAGRGVVRKGGNDAVAVGEAVVDGVVFGEADKGADHRAVDRFQRFELHGWAGAAGLDAEVVVGFAGEARSAPAAFERCLGDGDARGEAGDLRAGLGGGGGGGDELLFSHGSRERRFTQRTQRLHKGSVQASAAVLTSAAEAAYS